VPHFAGKGVFDEDLEPDSKAESAGVGQKRRRDESGREHFGANSAVFTAGKVLGEESLFRAAKMTDDSVYDPLLSASERSRAALDGPTTPAQVANGFYATMSRQFTYGTTDTTGARQLHNVTPGSVITVPVAMTRPHPGLLAAEADNYDLSDDPALKDYCDGEKPVGDTRALAGLTSVIFGNRDAINTNLRQYFITGCGHRGSAMYGYAKLWLYVISKDQMSLHAANAGMAALNFAPAAGINVPVVDDPYLGRGGFDAAAPGIINDTVGWMHVPSGTDPQVVEAMADFYRPFPAYTWQTNDYKPAALMNVMGGVNDCVASVPGGMAAQLGARNAAPSRQHYTMAIENLASFRDEEDSAVLGLGLAMLMASGRMLDFPADVDGGPGYRHLLPSLGPCNELVQWRRPPSNTLAIAYSVGVNGRSIPRVRKYTQLHSHFIMRAVHHRALVRTYCYQRVMQVLSITGSDMDAVFANAGPSRAVRDAVELLMGTNSSHAEPSKKLFWSMCLGIFGTPLSSSVENAIWRTRAQNAYAPAAGGFFWGRLRGPRNLMLSIHSADVLPLKTCDGMPYFMECVPAGGELSSMCFQENVRGQKTMLRTRFTTMTFGGAERYLTSDQFTELNQALSSIELAAPGLPVAPLNVRRRTVMYGSGGVMANAAPTLAYGVDPVHIGFMTIPYEIVAFCWQPVQSYAYELVEPGLVPMRAYMCGERVRPLGRAIDTDLDVGGLGYEPPASLLPGFMSNLMTGRDGQTAARADGQGTDESEVRGN
jgi:hypothetical protein